MWNPFAISVAHAQDAAGGAAGIAMQIMPLVLIFVVFYFLLIRPQQKRQKEHQTLIAKLAVGDEIVTAGGVLGKVTELGDSFVHVEIADGVVIKVQRPTISAVMPKGTFKSA